MAPNLNATVVTQGNCLKPLMAAPPSLPVIDLSQLDGPQHEQVVEDLIMAAEKFGFIQVVNHGIPVEFLEELKDSVYKFFNMSEEEKASFIPKEDALTQSMVTYNKGSGPEPVDVLFMISPSEEDAMKFWPDSCKEVTLKYRQSSAKLTERILQILMSNLGVTLNESMLHSYMGNKEVSMNYYPMYPSQNLEISAVRKHTDTSVLTVLLQDHIGGLFGKLKADGDMENNYKGEWVEIKPIPGALIVLVGDSLQVLSNGKYEAGEHYVQTTGKVTRVSVPAFMNPRSSAKLAPMSQAFDAKPRYKEFLYEEYRWNAIKNYEAGLTEAKPLQAFEIFPANP